jgi:hypothetical protein
MASFNVYKDKQGDDNETASYSNYHIDQDQVLALGSVTVTGTGPGAGTTTAVSVVNNAENPSTEVSHVIQPSKTHKYVETGTGIDTDTGLGIAHFLSDNDDGPGLSRKRGFSVMQTETTQTRATNTQMSNHANLEPESKLRKLSGKEAESDSAPETVRSHYNRQHQALRDRTLSQAQRLGNAISATATATATAAAAVQCQSQSQSQAQSRIRTCSDINTDALHESPSMLADEILYPSDSDSDSVLKHRTRNFYGRHISDPSSSNSPETPLSNAHTPSSGNETRAVTDSLDPAEMNVTGSMVSPSSSPPDVLNMFSSYSDSPVPVSHSPIVTVTTTNSPVVANPSSSSEFVSQVDSQGHTRSPTPGSGVPNPHPVVSSLSSSKFSPRRLSFSQSQQTMSTSCDAASLPTTAVAAIVGSMKINTQSDDIKSASAASAAHEMPTVKLASTDRLNQVQSTTAATTSTTSTSCGCKAGCVTSRCACFLNNASCSSSGNGTCTCSSCANIHIARPNGNGTSIPSCLLARLKALVKTRRMASLYLDETAQVDLRSTAHFACPQLQQYLASGDQAQLNRLLKRNLVTGPFQCPCGMLLYYSFCLEQFSVGSRWYHCKCRLCHDKCRTLPCRHVN